MNNPGLLRFEDFAKAMPITDVAYSNSLIFRDSTQLCITFEADYASVSNLIPEPLAFSDDRPIGTLTILHNAFSTVGSYYEALLSYRVSFQNRTYSYMVGTLVTGEAALLAGREMYGYPKRLADIRIESSDNTVIGTVACHKQNPMIRLMIRPETPILTDERQRFPELCLRMIPSVDPAAPPRICDLVTMSGVPSVIKTASDGMLDYWTGNCHLVWDDSAIDPAWRRPKELRILSCHSIKTVGSKIDRGTVVYDYLSQKNS